MAFTIGAVDGWTFTMSQTIRLHGRGSVLHSFALGGECRHGHELPVQDGPPIIHACDCWPSPPVLALQTKLHAKWFAKLSKPIASLR